jgi:hypothetical protein
LGTAVKAVAATSAVANAKPRPAFVRMAVLVIASSAIQPTQAEQTSRPTRVCDRNSITARKIRYSLSVAFAREPVTLNVSNYALE